MGKTFKDLAEQDESDVAVLGVSAGGMVQRSVAGRMEEFATVASSLEELDVGRESAGVGEQLANGDSGLAEFVKDGGGAGVEVEQSTLVEEHRHRGGGDDLGDGREVEDRVGLDSGRIRVVDEVTEALRGDECAMMRYSESRPGECALLDGCRE